MVEIKLALVQTALHWEDKESNLAMFDDKITSIKSDTDLIVLPEMFTTGFSMNPAQFAEEIDGPSMHWLKYQAAKSNACITGSIIIKDDGNYYNRLIWMRPNGSFEYYNKRHLFRLANEQDHYMAGTERKVVELGGWKINLNVCYDMRFPVWSRNIMDYDILLNVANWPAKRSHPWKTLMRARAIENMCYVIGLNRVGTDGNGYFHSGDSAIIHPDGTTITACSVREKILYATLNKNDLSEFRERFQFYKDKDDFKINV